MKNNMMKKAVAILLAATLTVPNYAVLAEDNTQIEAEAEAARAAEAAAKAEAERQAAEAAARAEAERQAAEAAARAEAERQAAEAAAKAEAERQAAEAAAKAEAERQAAEVAARAEAERLAAEEAARAEAERLAAEEAARAEAERQAAESTQSEATTEAPTEAVTEASTEASTEAVTEAPTEVSTEATTEAEKEEKETEKEYKTSFTFENEEVVIKVKVAKEAKLSKGTNLTAKKLEEGSEKYEAAKAATINSLGSDEEGTYSFYEIRFEKDGAELDVKDEHMDIDVTFKDASTAVQVKDGEAKRIQGILKTGKRNQRKLISFFSTRVKRNETSSFIYNRERLKSRKQQIYVIFGCLKQIKNILISNNKQNKQNNPQPEKIS